MRADRSFFVSRFRLGTRLIPCRCRGHQLERIASASRFSADRKLERSGRVSSAVLPRRKTVNQTEEVQMNSIRKSRFLLTTAVLLAGVGLASAQGMREGAGGGGMGAGGGIGAGGGTGGAAERGKSGGGMTQGPAGASRGEGMTQGRATEPRAGGRAER